VHVPHRGTLSYSDSTPPLAQLRVATTRHFGAQGRGSFRRLGVRSTVFGTFSPHTCFSGRFRLSPSTLLQRVATTHHRRCRFFFFPIALDFALYFGFRRLGFWVSHVGFGCCGCFLGRFFGIFVGFQRFVGLGCFRGRFGCFREGFP
jgi:hypothetical protein